MPHDSVSFVIPVRDGAPYLAECIQSTLQQTMRPHEVIVVDDGSRDDSAAIAESFGGVVRCIRRPALGQSAARNHGVNVSRGDFIAFLDADDIAAPIRLERQIARFSARPELEFCDAFAQNFWSPEIEPADRKATPREAYTHSFEPRARLIITWTFRRRLFERLGGFDEQQTFGEDTAWLDRVDDSGVPLETIREVLGFRRLHHCNLTRRNYDSHIREIVRHTRERLVLARRDRDKNR